MDDEEEIGLCFGMKQMMNGRGADEVITLCMEIMWHLLDMRSLNYTRMHLFDINILQTEQYYILFQFPKHAFVDIHYVVNV